MSNDPWLCEAHFILQNQQLATHSTMPCSTVEMTIAERLRKDQKATRELIELAHSFVPVMADAMQAIPFAEIPCVSLSVALTLDSETVANVMTALAAVDHLRERRDG